MDKNILSTSSKKVRQPAVAGQFYSGDKQTLKNKIEKIINKVDPPTPSTSAKATADKFAKGGNIIRAIMVPHAGYDYSGQIAAYGYKEILEKKVKTVVIICNSHSSYFSGLAIDDNDIWQTPFGEVEVDHDLADKLIESGDEIRYDAVVHESEHSLEVQLPFLQMVLGDGFKIVPILFGNAHDGAYKNLAKALADNLGDDDLIVISTDMSHYPVYDDAYRIDKKTLDIIKSLDVDDLNKHIKETEAKNIKNEQTLICGIDGVKTIMELANIKNWQAEILKYANSGDAPIGSRDQVVGYGAIKFKVVDNEINDTNTLTDVQKKILLDIATSTVESYVRNGLIPDFTVNDSRLNIKQGAFVTLHKNGQLRGCIGQIVPGDEPLWQVVRDMAMAAACEDPRFDPVSEDELKDITYEISVLSVPKKIENWQDIVLGRDGVIIKKGFRSGVFLPQVATETGWDKEEFLSELCSQKAGLPPESYIKDNEAELSVFTADIF